jgi:hypothetical protein
VYVFIAKAIKTQYFKCQKGPLFYKKGGYSFSYKAMGCTPSILTPPEKAQSESYTSPLLSPPHFRWLHLILKGDGFNLILIGVSTVYNLGV